MSRWSKDPVRYAVSRHADLGKNVLDCCAVLVLGRTIPCYFGVRPWKAAMLAIGKFPDGVVLEQDNRLVMARLAKLILLIPLGPYQSVTNAPWNDKFQFSKRQYFLLPSPS